MERETETPERAQIVVRTGPNLIHPPTRVIAGLQMFMSGMLELMPPGSFARCTVFDLIGSERNICFEYRLPEDPFDDNPSCTRIAVRSCPYPTVNDRK